MSGALPFSERIERMPFVAIQRAAGERMPFYCAKEPIRAHLFKNRQW